MSSSAGDNWSVLVTPADKSSTRACRYILRSETRLSTVKSLWSTDVGESPDSQSLLSVTGVRLDDALTLRDVGETFPTSRLVALEAESAMELSLRLFGEEREEKRVQAFPSDVPENIFPNVRRLFGVEESRTLRFLVPVAEGDPVALVLGLPLSSQSISGSLLVDFGVSITLTDLWTGRKENHLLFGSEKWSSLLPLPKSRPQRLELDGRTLVLDTALTPSLPSSLLTLSSVSVFLHQARTLTLASGPRINQRLVWPTQRASDISTRPLTLEGVVLDREATLAASGLQDFAVVRAETRPTWVLLSSGVCVQIATSSLDTVADLHAEVANREGSDSFELRRGSLTLRDHDVALNDLGLSVDAPLEVERCSVSLLVEVRGQTVHCLIERRFLRFSHIRDKLALLTEVGHKTLTETTLVCSGCGRQLRHTDEHCQVVPADCCEVRSLHLTDASRRDVAVQCTTSAEGGRRREVADDACQTDEVSTDVCSPDVSESRNEDCRVYVWVENGADLRIQQPFPSPVTVGDIRRAIAERMNARSMRIQMERWVSRSSDGCLCYQVCSEEGQLVGIGNELAEFGNAAGVIVAKQDSFGQFLIKQHFDEHEFPLVAGRWTVVNVYVLSTPMAPCRLYVCNDGGFNFPLSPLLVQPPTAAEIRDVVAREIKVKSEFIQLERWAAVGPGKRECFQVCDNNGCFVDVQDAERLEYGSADGQLFPKSAMTEEKIKILSQGAFVPVPNRRNVINLIQRHPLKQRISLLIVVAKSPNLIYEIRVSEPVTVGEIRQQLAIALQTVPARVQFERWIGTGPRGDECFQIGNRDGHLVGIASDDAEFATGTGRFYKKGDLIERGLRVMCIDNDEFKVAAGRPSVLNAYKLERPGVTLDIHISNMKGSDFSLNPTVRFPCLVGDIRAILAEVLKVRLGCVKMKRWMGKCGNNDATCVQLCSVEGKFLSINKPELEYGDAKGKVYNRRVIKDEALVELMNDETEFVVVPGRRLVLNVSQRHPPGKKLPLYLWRDNKLDILFSPLMPKEPRIKDLKKAVAAELRADWTRIGIHRWGGWSDRSNVVQICTKDDKFIGIGSNTAEFGKADGTVVKKDRVTRIKKQSLERDEDHFIFVPGRRCIINMD